MNLESKHFFKIYYQRQKYDDSWHEWEDERDLQPVFNHLFAKKELRNDFFFLGTKRLLCHFCFPLSSHEDEQCDQMLDCKVAQILQ